MLASLEEASVGGTAMADEDTLYGRLGGYDAIAAMVDNLLYRD